jgi:asparagine synthetase B (glutamine-hydrolysing)
LWHVWLVSRICGIIAPGWSKERIDGSLQRLISPLHHSHNFKIEKAISPNSRFARIYFEELNFSTHLYTTPDSNISCLFTGYLFEPRLLAERLAGKTASTPMDTNPAYLFAHLFPANRSKLLKNLSGSFVFALWEAERSTLTIATDRFGVIPLYYRELPGAFAFASEIKALRNLAPDPGTNYLALSEFFALGSPFGDHTLFYSITRLAPATVITVQDGRISSEKYWSFADLRSGPEPAVAEFVEESRRPLGRSIAKLVDQIDHPICLLSAGYDSRRILIELSDHRKSVATYTAPTITHDSPFVVDVPIASALCRELGATHVASTLPDTDTWGDLTRSAQALLDYETDSHAWLLPLLAEIPAASGVNFDGLGGDVLFEFNWTYPHLAGLTGDPSALAEAVEDRYPDLWKQYLRQPSPTPSLRDRWRQIFESLPDNRDRITQFFFTNWTRRKTVLSSQGLLNLKVDAVYPFLDYDLVDFVFRLPPLSRREAQVSRKMLELAHPGIMRRVPTSHDPGLHDPNDNHWSAYRTVAPARYWIDSQNSIHRAAAKDMIRSSWLFGQCTKAARISALVNSIPIPSMMLPSRVTRSSWRLPPLGLYARQYRSSAVPGLIEQTLACAREYVFGKI